VPYIEFLWPLSVSHTKLVAVFLVLQLQHAE
jgi:hypothetical protein